MLGDREKPIQLSKHFQIANELTFFTFAYFAKAEKFPSLNNLNIVHRRGRSRKVFTLYFEW